MSCDQSSNYVIRDFAKSLLNKMPRNALVLSKGDLPTNTLRFVRIINFVTKYTIKCQLMEKYS